MSSQPTVIEVAGIPYSKKTSTIGQLAKVLGERRIPFTVIEEYPGTRYPGTREFGDAAKMTPDINFARLMHCAKELTLAKYDPRISVVLIDRGIFDTYCWFKWFQSSEKLPGGMLDVALALLTLTKEHFGKYRTIWLDTEPVLAMSRHGPPGRIVNLANLTRMQMAYSSAVMEVAPGLTPERIDSNKARSTEIADKIGYILKLWPRN